VWFDKETMGIRKPRGDPDARPTNACVVLPSPQKGPQITGPPARGWLADESFLDSSCRPHSSCSVLLPLRAPILLVASIALLSSCSCQRLPFDQVARPLSSPGPSAAHQGYLDALWLHIVAPLCSLALLQRSAGCRTRSGRLWQSNVLQRAHNAL
jgi:hypothetical protein